MIWLAPNMDLVSNGKENKMVGNDSLMSVPLNCLSSLLSGKCRICHASTGMTNGSGVQMRGHITQEDSGFDHDGHPYCTFSYPCAVCGETVRVVFSNNSKYRVMFADRYEQTDIHAVV